MHVRRSRPVLRVGGEVVDGHGLENPIDHKARAVVSSGVFAPLNSIWSLKLILAPEFFIIVPFHPITLLTSSTDRAMI